MTISYRAVATSGAGASPRTVSKPTGTADGDTLFLQVTLADDIAPTVPTGFELVPGAEIGGTYGCRVYRKVAGASEPASYEISFASGIGAAGILALTGAQPVTAHAVAVRTNATSANRVWDGVTNTITDTFLACFGGFPTNNATTPDGAMTERWDFGTTGIRIYLMTQAVAGTGATGTRTATGITLASKCVTLSLTDAAAALVAPTALTATGASSSTVDLTWADSNTDETGFSIERSPAGAGTWAVVATTASLSYTNTGLSPSTAYDFRVRAYRGADFSGYTATATGTTEAAPLSAPTNLVAVALTTSEIDLTWDDANVEIVDFSVERSLAGAGTWVEIATMASNFYTDTGLSPGTAYDYRVRAFKL